MSEGFGEMGFDIYGGEDSEVTKSCGVVEEEAKDRPYVYDGGTHLFPFKKKLFIYFILSWLPTRIPFHSFIILLLMLQPYIHYFNHIDSNFVKILYKLFHTYY